MFTSRNEVCESCFVKVERDGIRSITYNNLLLAPQGVLEAERIFLCYHLAAQREKEGDRTFFSCVRVIDMVDRAYVYLLPPGTMLPSSLLQHGVVVLAN